jgi:uncharacterized protein YndB with AHSA1/START domain
MPDVASIPTVVHSTFVLERSYPTSPEQAFAAFADPTLKRRWYLDRSGREVEAFTMDFRVGGVDVGRYLMGNDTPFPGVALESVSTYLDIVTDRRIVMAYTMSIGGRRISASLATIEFLTKEQGTDLVFTEQSAFFEGSDGPAIRKDGWGKLLDALAKELNT